MSKTWARVLFVSGLVLEMGGFFVGHAEDIPTTVRIVARGYIRADSALATLSASESVRRDDPGFVELSDVILDDLRKTNAPKAVRDLKVSEFVPGVGGTVSILGAVSHRNTVVRVELSTGQTLNTSVQVLRPMVERLRRKSLFRTAIVVFTVGICLQIWGFLLDRRK